jgi:predicted kinase|tara:strand:- start:834 stop:1517 length:684 start_codon:yes stop_codon:yes gene_type:complete
MKKLNQILREGVYDPGIFKAFFLAGGPGSGKSFVTMGSFGGTGLKTVNSDTAFERGLKKGNLSLKMPDEEEYFRDIVRAKAKMTTATQLDTYIQGRLGLVIDATGRDITTISGQKSMLDLIGYDSYMIFINTSLEVALERNKNRPRTIPEYLVKNSWNQVQRNIGTFQRIFSPNRMLIVDNNRSEKELVTITLNTASKYIRSKLRASPQNLTAKQWIANELKAKQRT